VGVGVEVSDSVELCCQSSFFSSQSWLFF